MLPDGTGGGASENDRRFIRGKKDLICRQFLAKKLYSMLARTTSTAFPSIYSTFACSSAIMSAVFGFDISSASVTVQPRSATCRTKRSTFLVLLQLVRVDLCVPMAFSVAS